MIVHVEIHFDGETWWIGGRRATLAQVTVEWVEAPLRYQIDWTLGAYSEMSRLLES